MRVAAAVQWYAQGIVSQGKAAELAELTRGGILGRTPPPQRFRLAKSRPTSSPTKSMVPNRWVVNASPLILLGKVEQIQLLGALAGEIAVPRAVIREVSAKPDGERTVQTLTALESAIIVELR